MPPEVAPCPEALGNPTLGPSRKGAVFDLQCCVSRPMPHPGQGVIATDAVLEDGGPLRRQGLAVGRSLLG